MSNICAFILSILFIPVNCLLSGLSRAVSRHWLKISTNQEG
jgi:hypothetical protein